MLDQSFDNYEIIVVNDGSTDDTVACLEQLAASGGRNVEKLKVISKENGGVSAARNLGMANAVGEYIMFVDADDTIEPDCLAEIYGYVAGSESLPDYVIFGMKSVAINGATSMVAEFEYRNYSDPKDLFVSIHTNSLAFGAPWGKLYRRSVITANNLSFNPAYSRHEDAIFNCEYAPHCKRAMSLPTLVYSYIHNTGGATLKFFGEELVRMNNGVRQALIDYFVVYCKNQEALKSINHRLAFDYLFSIYSLYRRKGVKNKRFWTKRYWEAATANDGNWSRELDSGIPKLVGMTGRHSMTAVDILLRTIFGVERLSLAVKSTLGK